MKEVQKCRESKSDLICISSLSLSLSLSLFLSYKFRYLKLTLSISFSNTHFSLSLSQTHIFLSLSFSNTHFSLSCRYKLSHTSSNKSIRTLHLSLSFSFLLPPQTHSHLLFFLWSTKRVIFNCSQPHISSLSLYHSTIRVHAFYVPFSSFINMPFIFAFFHLGECPDWDISRRPPNKFAYKSSPIVWQIFEFVKSVPLKVNLLLILLDSF